MDSLQRPRVESIRRSRHGQQSDTEIGCGALFQARSFAQITASDLYPQLNGGVSAARQRISGNRPTLGAVTSPRPDTESTFQIPFNLNYEIDLFGRVRNSVWSANAGYQASAADLENVRLIVSAELAGNFFQLRELDAEMAVVRKAIDFEQAGLKLVENRHTGGAASGLDVAQQQTFLPASIAQLSLLQQQHDQFEHALAALQGLPASSFAAPVRALNVEPPAVPLMLPSELLQRRPDIAEAERSVAQANARIGVARQHSIRAFRCPAPNYWPPSGRAGFVGEWFHTRQWPDRTALCLLNVTRRAAVALHSPG